MQQADAQTGQRSSAQLLVHLDGRSEAGFRIRARFLRGARKQLRCFLFLGLFSRRAKRARARASGSSREKSNSG